MDRFELRKFLRNECLLQRIDSEAQKKGCKVPQDDSKYYLIVIKELEDLLKVTKSEKRTCMINEAIQLSKKIISEWDINKV